MPRHLISDAHEWINETPTVPIRITANPQPRERAWKKQRGKKTLLSLTLVCRAKWPSRCSIGRSRKANLKYSHWRRRFAYVVTGRLGEIPRFSRKPASGG